MQDAFLGFRRRERLKPTEQRLPNQSAFLITLWQGKESLGR